MTAGAIERRPWGAGAVPIRCFLPVTSEFHTGGIAGGLRWL